jgi:hemolysin activation/secretion protein
VLSTYLSLGVEHSRPAFDSSFTYTRYDGAVSQSVWFNPNHTVTLSLFRSGIEGQAPIQKEILIGGPLLLRGYPRTLALVNDQVAAVRMSYEATLSRGVWGGALQVRKIGMLLFADVGKGWDNHQSPDDVRQRQDVGIGLDVRVNAISFVEFPVRVDVAVPVNDPQYRRPQIILFEALAFF